MQKEIASRKIKEVKPPEYGFFPNATLKIFDTQACTLSCAGCFNASSLKHLSRGVSWHRLQPDQVKSAMKDTREAFGTRRVEFSGGEPLLEYTNLLDYIRYGKELGYITQITTNASLLGATGRYREQLQDILPEDVKNVTPVEMVSTLKEAGLDQVVISVDNMHTIHDNEFDPLKKLSPKAPTSTIANAIKILLEHGYGDPRPNENILNKYGVRIAMTASGEDWQASFDLVKEVMDKVGATLQPERRGRLWVFKTKDDKEITMHRNETADIGFGERVKDSGLGEELGTTIFDRNCYDFFPRSKGAGDGINQEIAVNYDGNVYNCAMQSYHLGNIGDNNIPEIVAYVNNGKPPEKYALGATMFKEVLDITEKTKGKSGWGEAYRRIYAMADAAGDEDTCTKVVTMRSHSGACHNLSRDPLFLKYLQQWNKLHSNLA